jgi:hypothetical protein
MISILLAIFTGQVYDYPDDPAGGHDSLMNKTIDDVATLVNPRSATLLKSQPQQDGSRCHVAKARECFFAVSTQIAAAPCSLPVGWRQSALPEITAGTAGRAADNQFQLLPGSPALGAGEHVTGNSDNSNLGVNYSNLPVAIIADAPSGATPTSITYSITFSESVSNLRPDRRRHLHRGGQLRRQQQLRGGHQQPG